MYFDTINEKKYGEPCMPKNRTEKNYKVVIMDNEIYYMGKSVNIIKKTTITNFDMDKIIKAIITIEIN